MGKEFSFEEIVLFSEILEKEIGVINLRQIRYNIRIQKTQQTKPSNSRGSTSSLGMGSLHISILIVKLQGASFHVI